MTKPVFNHTVEIKMNHLQVNDQQFAQLKSQGCSAADWRQVMIVPGLDLARIHDVNFIGTVRIGDTSGNHIVDGVELPCGLYRASIANCDIGDHVRVANLGSVLSNYVIENNAVIQDVAAMTSEANATFGNGTELETVNEGGGRVVRIINDLTSQTAYVQAMWRHNAGFTKNLTRLIDNHASYARSERGRIGEMARVLHCGTLLNVNVGPYAIVHGVQYLQNGTVNSCKEHPTEVGEGVQAKSFIFAEGARVESGAILDKVFVGQNAKMGKQYSAENSLFFANCESYHGEAVSLFAGPYTVTHHKSTLLIAGLFSFYNAGSGSNQSNHMYKLGPVHQGVLERGSKTGSFSYLLFGAHIGPFSVVIGKHYSNLDIPNLPFSYVFEESGSSKIVPAMNLVSVGTVRDGEKWPKRDGRKALNKRDLIVFDVFSPFTVEKMRRGRNQLTELGAKEPRDKMTLSIGGAQISRPSLEKGANRYSLAVKRYLIEKLMDKIRERVPRHSNWSSLAKSLKPTATLSNSSEWGDVAGLLAPREHLAELETQVADDSIKSYNELVSEFQKMYEEYRSYEWQYVFETYEQEFGVNLTGLTKDQVLRAGDTWEEAASLLHGMILEDSKKEFGAFAKIGFGLGQTEESRDLDFAAVRGTSETNSVVQKLVAEGAAIKKTKLEFDALVASIPK